MANRSARPVPQWRTDVTDPDYAATLRWVLAASPTAVAQRIVELEAELAKVRAAAADNGEGG